MNQRVFAFLLFSAASVLPVFGQGPVFDNSGNGKLSGTYYFRHVLYGLSTEADQSGITGDVSEAIALYGTVTFDGNGNYSMNGTVSDSYVDSENGGIVQDPLSCYNAGTVCNLGTGTAVSGTYAISASGFGYIVNAVTGDKVFGLVAANGVFIGSSTETTSAYNDLFIAAVATPSLTNSFFSGSYSAVGFWPGGGPAAFDNGTFGTPLLTLGASFQLTPNGGGSLGTFSLSGTSGSGSSVSQSINSAVSYNFSNGTAVVTFPSNQNGPFFLGGASTPEYLYFSQDGNFFFGGSPTLGFDMIVGVRNPGSLNFGGNLYYQAGLDQDESQLASGIADFDGYYGSFNATGSGDILIHQRLADLEYGTYGWTSADTFPSPLTSPYTDTVASVQYAFGANGAIRIGQGVWPYMGITIGLQAPALSGSGVWLNPAGVVSAATFSPFTAGISGGEMVTLFGSGLAPSTASATSLPLPTTLGGVQVLVDNVPAPLNYVSPTQILLNVPYSANSYAVANFQVNNNGNMSNGVTELVNQTTPGVFTGDYGLGYGYIEHSADYSLVTENSPAQPGETVIIYVDGLGTVYPPVADGAAAPSNPLSAASSTIAVDISGVAAPTPIFAGLTPTLSGLYQIDVQIPSTATAGDNTVDISGPDSYTTQALIPIGTGVGAADRKATANVRPQVHARPKAARKPFCFHGPGKICKAQ